MMPFEPKKTRNKIKSTYKSIYLRQAVVDELNRLAIEHNTSFNNIVVTMIEQCLDDVKFKQTQNVTNQ